MSASVKHRTSGRQGEKKGNRGKSERKVPDVDTPRAPAHTPWAPSTSTALKLLLSARLCAAIWSHVTDCDETFNYWEPLHYLLYGSGFQTWEYSPVYAIRSYAYLWLYALPMKIFALFGESGSMIVQFYFLRTVLAFCCGFCEVFFYRAVVKHFGPHPGRLLLCFLLFAPGFFISSTAFLPSTFSMYMTYLALGAWFTKKYPLAIFAVAASAIVGWPFVAVLGIPIAWDIIFRKQKVTIFVLWSLASAVICLGPLVAIDSHYYGKLAVTPLNIIAYNVFSEHGPDIYGVEPWGFYLMNGFLNFNFVFPLALVSVPVMMLLNIFVKMSKRDLPVWLSLAPMYIWIVIFFTRPHKEERFLFPVYPLFCLAAAVTMDHTQKFCSWLVSGPTRLKTYTKHTWWLALLFCVGFTALSMSRTIALYKGYHAPLDVYGELSQLETTKADEHKLPDVRLINVCVGKEWYRFPSSLFLPSHRWKLQFVRSEFRGQLPKQYSSDPDATKVIPTHMNDLNREEPTRYVDVSQCHYMIDLDLEKESQYEPRYAKRLNDWKLVATAKFLDHERSHSFYRAFYIPFLSEKHCVYADYNLLQSRRYREIKLKA